MNNSGDAAEQVVRLSLEGTEVALKLTGSAAKNIAAAIYAVLKNRDKNKIQGPPASHRHAEKRQGIKGVYNQRGTSETVCHRSQAVRRCLLRPAGEREIRRRYGGCDGAGRGRIENQSHCGEGSTLLRWIRRPSSMKSKRHGLRKVPGRKKGGSRCSPKGPARKER